MEVEIEHNPPKDKLESMGVFSWPIWEKEPSEFNWEYFETEVCYFLEGKVTVETADGKRYEIKAGDLVRFPKGLKCKWIVHEKVRKHYNFE